MANNAKDKIKNKSKKWHRKNPTAKKNNLNEFLPDNGPNFGP